jgi:hypothetical protein
MEKENNVREVNLRNLLYYYKTGLDVSEDRVKKTDQECRKYIYEDVVDTVKYFSSKQNCMQNVNFEISPYQLVRMKPSEICELYNRFNKTATGIFGLDYDNKTNMILEDMRGNKYHILPLSPKGYNVSCYKLSFYNENGVGFICKMSVSLADDCFTNDQKNQIMNIHELKQEYDDRKKKSKDRYEEICKYKEYISIERISNGYRRYNSVAKVKKTIPIKLKPDEVAKYIDDWNYCFGGRINSISETEEETVYNITVYTD